MKTLLWKAALFALVLLVGSPAQAAVSEASSPGTTSNLFRRGYSLAPNEQITLQTSACDPGEDTVMYFIDGTPNLGGARITRAYNDDFGTSVCSFINFTNGPVAKDYTLVISSYWQNSPAAVTLAVWRTSNPTQITEPINVGGFRYSFSNITGARTFKAVGLRPGVGGGIVDTVLYAFNTTIGGTSYFDDDSGPIQLSSIFNVTMNCPFLSSCAIVAGTYSGVGGTKIQVWSSEVISSTTDDSDG